MKFSILLLVLSLKLKLTARFSPAFRELLRRKEFVLVIRTADEKQARTFIVSNGSFRSHTGSDRTADTELVWQDADTAVRIMLSSNELDSFSAIGRSRLRILGNFEYAMWFIDLAG